MLYVDKNLFQRLYLLWNIFFPVVMRTYFIFCKQLLCWKNRWNLHSSL